MELKEILAISGQPGLYKFVAQSARGVIVESLLDGRRMNASANAKVRWVRRTPYWWCTHRQRHSARLP